MSPRVVKQHANPVVLAAVARLVVALVAAKTPPAFRAVSTKANHKKSANRIATAPREAVELVPMVKSPETAVLMGKMKAQANPVVKAHRTVTMALMRAWTKPATTNASLKVNHRRFAPGPAVKVGTISNRMAARSYDEQMTGFAQLQSTPHAVHASGQQLSYSTQSGVQ
jgi:hypothetical protein